MTTRISVFVLALTLTASVAPAQTAQPDPKPNPNNAVGEKNWIEFGANWWQPGIDGSVQSDRLGLAGSQIDFQGDLAFDTSRQADFRLVLRPAKKHKIRMQYTPTEFTGESLLTRDINFAGTVYPVSLPVESQLTWRVFRVGYQWDFFYRPRGFVGVIIETGMINMNAGIDSIIGSAEVAATSPIVAFGLAGRFYPIRHLAINMEGTGLLADVDAENSLETLALDFSATYNFTNYVGVSGGWKRTSTKLQLDADRGTVIFAGLWIGGVFRY